MTKTPIAAPRLSAPAMIFGHDMAENAEILASLVDNIEIVLFHTSSQNNFPTHRKIGALQEIARKHGISYTVHLPAGLEIASPDSKLRESSVLLAAELVCLCATLSPRHFVLHVPYKPPTLVYQPGQYDKHIDERTWGAWLSRATESLKALGESIDRETSLLIENINYSLCYFEPLVEKNLCEICLDIGHLLLGQETVTPAIARYHGAIREVHLHGVLGASDHLGIETIPQNRLFKWMRQLKELKFSGILNLEVFTPTDLMSSLDIINRIIR